MEFPQCPWTIKDIFMVLIYSFAIFMVVVFWLHVLPLILLFFSKGKIFLPYSMAEYFRSSRNLYSLIIYYFALLIAIDTKILTKYKINWIDFFVRKDHIKNDILYGSVMYLKFAVFIIFIVFLSALIFSMADMVFQTNITGHVDFFSKVYQIEKTAAVNRVRGPLGLAVLFILAPFFEEIFFRGCLYRTLRMSMTKYPSIILSSVIFSILHGYFIGFIYVFLVGIMLAYIYEKRRSLVAPLAFHMMNNLLVAVTLFL